MGSLKRPLAVIGFSMLLTVLCIILTDCTALAVCATVFACVCLIVAVAFRFKAADTIFALGVGIIFAALLLLSARYNHDKTMLLIGEHRYVEAVVSSDAEYSAERNRNYVVATLKTIDSKKVSCKIRLSFPTAADDKSNELKIGDKIKFVGNVYKIGSDSHDVHNSFLAEKIYFGAYSIKLFDVKKPIARPLTYYVDLLRNKINDILNKSYSDEVSGLINAMLTGDKSDCPGGVYMSFKRSGTSHIMAVSGLHLSVWISLLFLLFRNNERMRRVRLFIGLPFIIFFVLLADFSPSVCRAALMSLLYLVGSHLRKDADALNTIGFALICILISNPFAVFSISFQLSFSCVIAIAVVGVPLCNHFEKELRKAIKIKKMYKSTLYVLSSVIISTSISVATFPISSFHFGYVSLVSPIANLFVIPVCAPVLINSVLFLVFSGVPVVSDFFRLITDVLCKYMIFVTEDFSSLSFSSVPTDAREVLLWLSGIFAFGVLFFLKRINRKSMLNTASVLMIILTMFSVLSIVENRTNECKLKVINTESGSATVFIYNGKGVLLGVSDDYYFSDTLESVVEAEDLDIVGAIPVNKRDSEELEYICNDFKIENLISSGESIKLFGDAEIFAKENGIEISVKGKSVAVFSSSCLQVDKHYDIIIRNDGVITFEDGSVVSSDKQGHSFTVYIDEKNMQVWREEMWPNLMKKS